MPSVTLAFSVFCAMEADICSIEALVSSTDAACSEAPWLMLWAVAEICSEALVRASALLRTSPMICASFSLMPLIAASMLLVSPSRVLTSVLRSPAAMRLTTSTA